ncbi:MAG: MFS transporter [Chloroflexota bacterium]|nr:MFS transporter [Chloroflexota bacterium]
MTRITLPSAQNGEVLPEHYYRNFGAGLIHGVFFQASAAFSNIHTVLPSLVAMLTPAASAVGLMASLQAIGAVIPQLSTAYLIDGRQRKKPWLMAIIITRFLALGLLAWLIFQFGVSRPGLVLFALIGLFGLFSLIGGMGTVIYADIFARAIPARRRGRFAGSKQLFGFGLAILAGLVVKWILDQPERFPFATNYALIIALSAAVLAVALIGFALIKEPQGKNQRLLTSPRDLLRTSGQLFKGSNNLRMLLLNRSLLTLSLALAPFFVVYAHNDLNVAASVIGLYLALQMVGAASSNILWAWLSDSYGNRLVIVGVGLTFALAAGLAWLTPSHMSWLFGGVFLLLGATLSGVQVGYSNIILEMADESTRPVCVALQNTALAPLAFAPLLVGFLAAWWSYPTLFAIAGILALASLLVAIMFLREPRYDPTARCCVAASPETSDAEKCEP